MVFLRRTFTPSMAVALLASRAIEHLHDLDTVFTGLGAGTHTLPVWVDASDGGTCAVNPGNHPNGAVIEELGPGVVVAP